MFMKYGAIWGQAKIEGPAHQYLITLGGGVHHFENVLALTEKRERSISLAQRELPHHPQ